MSLHRPTVVVVGLTLAAGIHLGVAAQHRDAAVHGLFFLLVGIGQLILAILLRRRPSSRLLVGAIASGAALTVIWAATRLPLPEPREPVGALDVTATALAIVTGYAAWRERRQVPTLRAHAPGGVPAHLLGSALVITVLTSAVGGSTHSRGHHHHDGPPAPSTQGERLFGDLFEDHHGHTAAPTQESGNEDGEAAGS
jgi:hypothetical protein